MNGKHSIVRRILGRALAFAAGLVAMPALSQIAITAPSGIAKPPFAFDQQSSALLDEVQLGCINYLVNEVDPITLMVLDRTGLPVISVAGVGFQLTALCIADERGWLPPGSAASRAFVIINALHSNPANRERGLFYHYLDPGTAGPSQAGYEDVVSTVDTALLFAGLLTASAHFGGPIAALADELVLEADWQSFVLDDPSYGDVNGFISLGWEDPGPGQPFANGLLPFAWADAGDEQRLTSFIARLSSDPAHRVGPEVYYRMRRTLGTIPDGSPVVWFPWSGALFTAFFSHCWIDYAKLGPDNPARFGVQNRPRVDWWENSRRTALLHRQKALANPLGLPGIGPNTWGLSASDGETGYIVPGVFPTLSAQQFGSPGVDHLTIQPADNWADGTLAPYSAGCTIMFEPNLAVAALQTYRNIAANVAPALWDDPATGGYGFADSYRASPTGGVAWVAPDRVAIDVGPLVIAIENARSGFVWDTFGSHPAVRVMLRRERIQQGFRQAP